LYIQFEVLKQGKVLFSRKKDYFLDVKRKHLGDYLEMLHLYERMSRKILTPTGLASNYFKDRKA
jgi:hypothetical protein